MRAVLIFLAFLVGFSLAGAALYFVVQPIYRFSKWLETNTRLGDNAYVVVPMALVILMLSLCGTWLALVTTAHINSR